MAEGYDDASQAEEGLWRIARVIVKLHNRCGAGGPFWEGNVSGSEGSDEEHHVLPDWQMNVSKASKALVRMKKKGFILKVGRKRVYYLLDGDSTPFIFICLRRYIYSSDNPGIISLAL